MNTLPIEVCITPPKEASDEPARVTLFQPSYITTLFTSGNFYENFMNYHNTYPIILDRCPVCCAHEEKSFNTLDSRHVEVKIKMWESFPFSHWFECLACSCVFSKTRPPKKLLNFLYTYCYPNPNKESRLFQLFDIERKLIKGRTLDLGGGPGNAREFCESYLNVDICASADIVMNIDNNNNERIIEDIIKWKPDRIVCSDLIEHVLYPRNIFNLAKISLEKGGELLLNVGQFHNSSQKTHIFHPPHITSFSSKTIKSLCEDYGFLIKKQAKESFTLVRK